MKRTIELIGGPLDGEKIITDVPGDTYHVPLRQPLGPLSMDDGDYIPTAVRMRVGVYRGMHRYWFWEGEFERGT